MSASDFNLLDTKLGDRVLNTAAIANIFQNGTQAQKDTLASVLEAILAADPTPGPVVAEELELDTGVKTAAATSGAATLDKSSGVITSEALSTAAGSDYTLTLTDNKVAAGDLVFASAFLEGSTTGEPVVTSVKTAANTVTIKVRNIDATNPFNGTIGISFMVLKAGAPT